MVEHPSFKELSDLSCGALEPARASAVVLHLLAPCRRCLKKAPPRLAVLLGVEPSPRKTDAAYDAAFDRALAKAKRVEQAVQREVEEAASVQGALSQGGMEAMQKLPLKMDPVARIEALLTRSWALRHDDPRLMLIFAWSAVMAADRLSLARYSAQRVMDIRAKAWAEWGNAFRVNSQLDEAVRTLHRARELFEQGSGDQFLETRIDELEATLAAAKRDFATADQKLLRVQRFYQRHRDPHKVGRALILRGLYASYGGRDEEALERVREGGALVDESRDPSILLTAVQIQLFLLIETGCFEEARRFRFRNLAQLVRPNGRVSELDNLALEGRLEAGLGKHERAGNLLREVVAGYNQIGRPYKAAIESLHLAASLLALGKSEEAVEVVREAGTVFIRLRIAREGIATVVMLRQAIEMGLATSAGAAKVAAYLRRLENDPEAVFRMEELTG